MWQIPGRVLPVRLSAYANTLDCYVFVALGFTSDFLTVDSHYLPARTRAGWLGSIDSSCWILEFRDKTEYRKTHARMTIETDVMRTAATKPTPFAKVCPPLQCLAKSLLAGAPWLRSFSD